MRTLILIAVLGTGLTLASNAVAQVTVESAVRTGVLVPTGSATGAASDSLSDTFSVQFPLFFDLGIRPVPRLFVGAYAGMGMGNAGGETADSCDRQRASCMGSSTRLGLEAHWHFRTRDMTHAWIGYGFGYEWARMTMSAHGSQSVSYRGPEYGHLMLGVDFASPRFVNLGILLDYSLASYQSMRVKSWSSPSRSVDSFDTALHGWLMLGLRAVMLP